MKQPFDVSKNKAIMTLDDIKRQQAECLDNAKQISQAAEDAGGRDLTAEEQEEFDLYMEEHDRLAEQYAEQLAADQRSARKVALEEAEGRLNAAPSPRSVLSAGPYARVTHLHDRVLDDPRRGYKHFGEFAASIHQAYTPGQGMPDERLVKIGAATGMNQSQGSQGGYMVPPEFSTGIWDGMNQMPENLMALCDTYTITGESLTFTANAETSRATGSRYGGVRSYWIAEGSQITASTPTVRQMRLEPQELAVLVYVTDKLLNNAPALSQYLGRAATEEIMFLVNDAIINGNGVGQPKGILTSGSLITVSKESGQAAATIEIENINKMYARLHARARTGAVWFINQDVEPELEALATVIGTGGIPVFLASPTGFPNVAEAPQRRLKGLPLRSIEYCSTLGTVGDVVLANLGFYALGLRGGISEAMSIHLRFDYAETAFRFMFAVDGQSWLQAPQTPFKGSNTLSPFVTLATRA